MGERRPSLLVLVVQEDLVQVLGDEAPEVAEVDRLVGPGGLARRLLAGQGQDAVTARQLQGARMQLLQGALGAQLPVPPQVPTHVDSPARQ